MPLHRPSLKSLTRPRILFAHMALPVLLMVATLSQPGEAQTWVTLPGAAVDIGANASGVVWVIGTAQVSGGYMIYRWNNGNWQNIPGGAVRVSVDTDGTAWVVNNTHNIFHSNANGQWTNVSGGATDIGVGGNGAVWIIGANGIDIDYAVFAPGTRTVTGWKQVPGGASRIAVDPSGNPWVVNSAGTIFHWQGSSWATTSGGAKDIAVGADGTVYVVGTSPSASGGTAVWQYLGNNYWKQLNVGAANIAAGPAGSIYITQDGTKQYAILSSSGAPNLSIAARAQSHNNLASATTPNNSPGQLTLNGSGSTLSMPGGQVSNPGGTGQLALNGSGSPLIISGGQVQSLGGTSPLLVDGPPPYAVPTTLPAGFVICPTFSNQVVVTPCQTFVNNSSQAAIYVHSHSGGVAVYLGKTYGGDTCPSGWRDDGDYCAKPSSYGRGAGYGWQIQDGVSNSGMLSRCQHDNPNGCEMNGALAYPTCNTNFHAAGCCVCSPNCPSGWDDIGVSCKKQHGAADCSSYPVPGGYGHPFSDPRNGGECWVCPALLPRTMAAVNSTDPNFPPCAVGNDDGLVWQSPQYPEPGIYPFITKGILSSAFGNPMQVDAFLSQLAGGNATTKAQLWQQMATSPSDSPAFKALIFGAMLATATNANPSVGAGGTLVAFQNYIRSRQTFVAQDAVNMYNYYLQINAVQSNKAVGASIAGGGFSSSIAGQLGVAPSDYISAAYAAAFPDPNGAAFVTDVQQLNGLTWSQNNTTVNPGFDLTNIKNITATLAFATSRLDSIQDGMKLAATTMAAKFASARLGYALAGLDLAGALVSAAVDFSGEVMTLTAQTDARNTYSQLVQNANQPVSISQILTTGSQSDQAKLVLWWALATSPYNASNTAGDSKAVISGATLCTAYQYQCGLAKAAVTQAQAQAALAAVSAPVAATVPASALPMPLQSALRQSSKTLPGGN